MAPPMRTANETVPRGGPRTLSSCGRTSPAGHPRRSHSILVAPVAVFIVGLLLAGSACASASSTTFVWKAPYSGNTTTSHKIDAGICTGKAIAAPTFDLTDGNVTGGGSVKAWTCTSSNTSTSNAYMEGKGELELPSFTGYSGTFNVTLKWTLNFKIELTMSGTTCSQGAQLDDAGVDLGVGVVNESTGKPLAEHVKTFSKELYGSGSLTATYSTDHTEKVKVLLDGQDSYSVVAALGFVMQVEVNNPTPGNPTSCTATADVTYLSGNTLATLVHAELA
jgi:hypothetical protein